VTPCFNDWKRFCAVLREIASGQDGGPLAGFEAQKRAQAVLTECGYSWRRVTANGSNSAPETNGSLEKVPDSAHDIVDATARKPFYSATVNPGRTRANGRANR
jgi:hypothetical protein